MSKRCAVRCVETGDEYATIREAAKDFNLTPSNIVQCCRGLQETVGGFHWIYMDHPVHSHSLSIEKVGGRWGVYYNSILLKTFKWREFAEVYALDSAIDDAKERHIKKIKN